MTALQQDVFLSVPTPFPHQNKQPDKQKARSILV